MSGQAKIWLDGKFPIYVWVGGPPTPQETLDSPAFTVFPGARRWTSASTATRRDDLEHSEDWFIGDIGDSERFDQMEDEGVIDLLIDAHIIEDRIDLRHEPQHDYPELASDVVRGGWTLIKVPDWIPGGRLGDPPDGYYVLDKEVSDDFNRYHFEPTPLRDMATWWEAIEAYRRGQPEALVLSDMLQHQGLVRGVPTDWPAAGDFAALDLYSRKLRGDRRENPGRHSRKRRLMR